MVLRPPYLSAWSDEGCLMGKEDNNHESSTSKKGRESCSLSRGWYEPGQALSPQPSARSLLVLESTYRHLNRVHAAPPSQRPTCHRSMPPASLRDPRWPGAFAVAPGGSVVRWISSRSFDLTSVVRFSTLERGSRQRNPSCRSCESVRSGCGESGFFPLKGLRSGSPLAFRHATVSKTELAQM